MHGYCIGKLIEIERKRKGVTQKQLALGIFTSQMLSKLEKDESESDKLQVDMLLQRLGRSPDKLEIFMSASEYKKIRMRDLIEELILKKKAGKVEYLLEKYRESYGENNNVHMMYYNRTKAYLIMRTDGDVNEAFRYIITALDLTLPGWNENSFNEYLISSYEMENLLLYGKILYLMGRTDEAREHLEKCHEYIENQYKDADTEEYAKIYPKCVWLMSKVYSEPEHDERIIVFCEKALDYLRREAIGCFAVPVLEETVARYNRMGNHEKTSYWNRFYSTLKSLYEEYAPDVCLDSLFSNVCQREYHLDYETVRGGRLSKGYTQEEMAKGIYNSPRAVSLIESHQKMARKKNFEQLMGNMGLEKSKYNGLVATDSFDVLQKKNVLDYFNCVCDYDSADKLLDEIQELLDMSVEDNRRFVEAYRLDHDFKRKKVPAEQVLQKCKVLLAETYNIYAEENRPPMRNEQNFISQIGSCLVHMDKLDEAITLYEKVIHYYEKSKMDIKYHVRSYSSLNIGYMWTLYDNRNDEIAELQAEKALENALKYAKTRGLSHYCLVKAYSNYKNKDYPDICSDFMKKAYNMYEFNYEMANCKMIADEYKRLYDKAII